MVLIVCISDNMGLAFNGRRQSRDAILSEDIIKMIKGHTMMIHPKAELLFESAANIQSSEDYLKKLDALSKEDYCFYEGEGEISFEKVTTIVVYRWNRDYPADKFFGIPKGFKKISSSEFKGKSHAKITKEVWNV